MHHANTRAQDVEPERALRILVAMVLLLLAALVLEASPRAHAASADEAAEPGAPEETTLESTESKPAKNKYLGRKAFRTGR